MLGADLTTHLYTSYPTVTDEATKFQFFHSAPLRWLIWDDSLAYVRGFVWIKCDVK